MADEEDTFHTSTVEADRARMQGLGLGARELAAQRDPQTSGGEQDVDQADGQVGRPDPDAATPVGSPADPGDGVAQRDGDAVGPGQASDGPGAGI